MNHPGRQHISEDVLEEIALGRKPSSGRSDGLRHIDICAYCMERLEVERQTIYLIRNTLRADSSGMISGCSSTEKTENWAG